MHSQQQRLHTALSAPAVPPSCYLASILPCGNVWSRVPVDASHSFCILFFPILFSSATPPFALPLPNTCQPCSVLPPTLCCHTPATRLSLRFLPSSPPVLLPARCSHLQLRPSFRACQQARTSTSWYLLFDTPFVVRQPSTACSAAVGCLPCVAPRLAPSMHSFSPQTSHPPLHGTLRAPALCFVLMPAHHTPVFRPPVSTM